MSNDDPNVMRTEAASRFGLKRILRGGLTAFAIYAAGIGLAYVSQFAVAAVAGAETYGLYSYVLAWVVPLAYVSALGFDVGLMRFLPAYEVAGDRQRLRGVLRHAQRLVALTGLAIALACIALVVCARPPDTRTATFVLGFAMIPALALLQVRCAAVRGLGGVAFAILPDRIVREGVLILLVLAAYYGFGMVPGPEDVMAAVLAATLIGLICAIEPLRRLTPALAAGETALTDERERWYRIVVPLLVIGATEVLMNRIGVLLIGWFGDTRSAGVYSLAFNIALVVTLPKVALNTLFAPAISRHHAQNDRKAMQTAVTVTALSTLVAAGAIALVLFVFAERLLGWFGQEFEAGATALRILLVGHVIAAAAGSQLYVMIMAERERAAARILLAMAGINFLLSAALIAPLGLVGAAIASSITMILWNAAMAVFLWRSLKIVPGLVAPLVGWGGAAAAIVAPAVSASEPLAPDRAEQT